MENMKNIKNKKLNNKGFSLVELIVVVLILGILAAAVTPSVMKYVNQARKNTDKMNAGTYKSAIRIALLDEDLLADGEKIPTSGKYAFTLSKDGVTVYGKVESKDETTGKYSVTIAEKDYTPIKGEAILIKVIKGGISDWADAESDDVFVAIIDFDNGKSEPDIYVKPVSKTATEFNFNAD